MVSEIEERSRPPLTADELVSFRQSLRRNVLDAPEGVWDDEAKAAGEVLSRKTSDLLGIVGEPEGASRGRSD